MDGGDYTAFLANTTQTSLIYQGNPGDTAQFVVLSSDNAGNVEAAPDGVFLPPYDPQINLGGPPAAAVDADQRAAAGRRRRHPGEQQPAVRAGAKGLPSLGAGRRSLPTSRRSPPTVPARRLRHRLRRLRQPASVRWASPSRRTARASTSAAALAATTCTSSASPAASAITPLATLDEPLYDMAFDANGHLWATTGGGPLVRDRPDHRANHQQLRQRHHARPGDRPRLHEDLRRHRHRLDIFDTKPICSRRFPRRAWTAWRSAPPTARCGASPGRSTVRS